MMQKNMFGWRFGGLSGMRYFTPSFILRHCGVASLGKRSAVTTTEHDVDPVLYCFIGGVAGDLLPLLVKVHDRYNELKVDYTRLRSCLEKNHARL
jgi:hypothetical protein